jgi:hypothetical protein
MLGANSSLNSCSADSADHADIVSRCCTVFDSLKEFCPQRFLLGPAACWIVKPNCSSRGVGVRLTDDMVELAAGKSEGRVVQKYIERPLLINGKKVVNPLRQEVTTIRSIIPGEYVANVHYYETKELDPNEPKAGGPVEATLTVIKVNPKAEIIFYGQAVLEGRGKETTLLRFTVAPDGSVNNINTISKSLVKSIT